MTYAFTRTGPEIEAIHNTVADPSTNQSFTNAIGEIVVPNYSILEFDSVSSAISEIVTKNYPVGSSLSVKDYYGGLNPSNSGVLFFRVVAAGTGADDGGKYIDVDATRQLEQNLKTPYNVKAWGAKGDARLANGSQNPTPTDDYDSFLATINYAKINFERKPSVILSNSPSGDIFLPRSHYMLGTPLDIDDAYDLIIYGEGVGATRLINGFSGDYLIKFTDCSYPTIKDFAIFIDTSTTMTTAIRVRQEISSVNNNPTNARFINVRIDMNDVGTYGVIIDQDTGTPATNDFNFFDRVAIKGYSFAAVYLSGLQSHLNKFNHCIFNGINLAEDQIPVGKYGIYAAVDINQSSASFQWEGGACGFHSMADFFIGGANQGCSIRSVSSEQSVQMVDTGANGMVNLTIDGYRFDTQQNVRDGHWVNMRGGGNLVMTNSKVASPGKGTINIDKSVCAQGAIDNCSFSWYSDSSNNSSTDSIISGSGQAYNTDIAVTRSRFLPVGQLPNQISEYLYLTGSTASEIGLIATHGEVTYNYELDNVADVVGAKPAYHGQKITIQNNGSNALTIKHVFGTTYNKFTNKSGADIVLNDLQSVSYEFNESRGRWVEI